MRMRMRLRLASLVAALLLASPAHAHDYWLEFQPLQPTVGADLTLALWVGEDFVGETEKQFDKTRFSALRHVTSASNTDLLPTAIDGAVPIHHLKLAAPGGHLLAVERTPVRITLRARKFNHYLEHEGLHHVLAQRHAALEHLWPGHERYTRHLKAFVQIGEQADGVSTKVLGHRIEIVPDRDLALIKPGERFGVVVLFDGKPLPGLQVEAFVRQGGTTRGQMATSDAAGRVQFTAQTSGAWLVRTLHMQRCSGCIGADWESFWAGYSFAVR